MTIESMSSIRMKRVEMIDRLETLLTWAREQDEKAAADHAKAEREYLRRFRAACKQAAKWDYATAKENGFAPERLLRGPNEYGYGAARPICPLGVERRLREALAALRADGRTTVTVKAGTFVYGCLAYDEMVANLPPAVC